MRSWRGRSVGLKNMKKLQEFSQEEAWYPSIIALEPGNKKTWTQNQYGTNVGWCYCKIKTTWEKRINPRHSCAIIYCKKGNLFLKEINGFMLNVTDLGRGHSCHPGHYILRFHDMKARHKVSLLTSTRKLSQTGIVIFGYPSKQSSPKARLHQQQ